VLLSEKLSTLSAELEGRRVSISCCNPNNIEYIQMLEQQVNQFKSDFESERHDRQQTQARVDDLIKQLSDTESDVC